jgi:hypothetical protein
MTGGIMMTARCVSGEAEGYEEAVGEGKERRLGCVSFWYAARGRRRLTVVIDRQPSDLSSGAMLDVLPGAWRHALPDAQAEDGPVTAWDPCPRAGMRCLPRAEPRFLAQARSRGAGQSMAGAADRWESSPLPFVTLLARHTPYIKARAVRLARRDRDLQDDLQQEGRIALWRLDPVRVVSAERPDRYCRATIRFAMARYLRTQGRQLPTGRAIAWDRVEVVLDQYRQKAA